MSALIDIRSGSPSSPTPADSLAPGAIFFKGDVRFVSPEERTGLHGAITPRGLLAVEIADPPWIYNPPAGTGVAKQRGKLRDAIEWAIESALEANGAPPAGIGDGDLDQNLSDQLFRARSVGASGVALYFPQLAAAGSLAGALDAEDSAVLRWWIAATSERPVVLLLDAANRAVAAYGPPTRLERIVEAARLVDVVAPPHGAPLVSAAFKDDGRIEATATVAVELPEPAAMNAEPTLAAPPHEPLASDAAAVENETGAPAAKGTEPTHEPPRGSGRQRPPLRAVEPPTQVKAMFTDRVVPIFPRREALPAKSAQFTDRKTAVAASLDWRGFANELEVARGPKPLTIVERLFMSRYIPLVEAVARGEADDAARRTAERWAENFARSYTEGFAAFKVTGKRPRMVLDAPQLCNQIARLHGAKSTQLVLVDAMRFDLGVRVHDRMRDSLTSQATCTERLLLWSALPTTTPTQLELLAHGPDALASSNAPSEREEPGLRGRTSGTLRRIKVGARDVLKLDVVESRLRESGPVLAERLDAMAEEVAIAISNHARNLAPRTLLFVFGDHGFRVDPSDGGTLAGTSGGASPEEVLVPAFGWLIGDVH